MKIEDITNLNEAPIGDYETVGNFEKGSSFTDKRDRFLVTNPRTIEHVKKKFANTDYDFDFYFVNTPKARNHTEVGLVDLKWIKNNLEEEVYDKVSANMDNDAVKIIFTNNKGDQRVPLTAWIIAHRISHVLLRADIQGMSYHRESFDTFISQTTNIIELAYGRDLGIHRFRSLASANRKTQLIYKNFWTSVCTFKSAREKNLRDWFEAFNELFAQYIVSDIKFNSLPNIVKVGNTSVLNSKLAIDFEEANSMLEMLEGDMEMLFDGSIGASLNKFFVM